MDAISAPSKKRATSTELLSYVRPDLGEMRYLDVLGEMDVESRQALLTSLLAEKDYSKRVDNLVNACKLALSGEDE